MVPETRIQEAARALAQAAAGPAKVILFGSHARGDARSDSDIDFLVIERDVEDRFDESARLGRLLGQLRIPADVVVVTERQVEEWAEVKGTMLYDALAEGRVLVET